MGRGSALPKLLGARPVHEEAEDSGFLYYTRFFRGDLPELRGAPLTPLGTFSILTLPGDAGTWCVTLYASARDQRAQARCATPAHWTALVRALPAPRALARRRADHGRDGDGRRDRPLPRSTGAGPPGLVSVGDAWACTNPSLGRGMSLGLAHAALLRRTVREHGDRPVELADAFAAATERELAPYYRATVAADRARLAEIDALRTGARTPAAGPTLRAAFARRDAPRRRRLPRRARHLGCLALPQDVFARPGFAERCSRPTRRRPVRPRALALALEQHLRQRPVVLDRLRPVAERLEADVVGARVEVGADRLGDRLRLSRAGSRRRSAGRCRRRRCRPR